MVVTDMLVDGSLCFNTYVFVCNQSSLTYVIHTNDAILQGKQRHKYNIERKREREREREREVG